MEKQNKNYEILDMMDRPGFFVQNGIVIHANADARRYLIEESMKIDDLLLTGKQEYTDFSEGCLYLTFKVNDIVHEAVVTKVDDSDLFMLEHTPSRGELQAFALAATQLRIPLSDAILAADELTAMSKDTEHVARINRSLSRLLRIIGNMSDASESLNYNSSMAVCDVCAIFSEILEKAKTLFELVGIQLSYSLPDMSIFSLADKTMLDRAVYNLLSNAAKYAPKGSSLHAKLVRNGHLLYFTVSGPLDSGVQIPVNIFTRFLRQPGIEDFRNGIGLGMVLVRNTASAHGGTVLLEKNGAEDVRVTMTMVVRKSANATVRDNILKPDVYGGRNQALIELSDVLSNDLYNGKY